MCFVILPRKAILGLLLTVVVCCPVLGAAISDHPDLISRASYYVATVDGIQLGSVSAVDGAAISANVGLSKPPGGTKMHPDLRLFGKEDYSRVTVHFTSISPAFVQWINDTWDDKAEKKSLRIACLSYEGNILWDRTYGLASISELIMQESELAAREGRPGEGLLAALKSGVFKVSFLYGSIVDNSGSSPTDFGPLADSLRLTGLGAQVALDDLAAFRPALVEPIYIKVHTPLGRGPGADPTDIPRTVVSNIVVTVPFSNAGEILSWAKTWFPLTSVGSAGIEKNGTMVWINESAETTCTLGLKNVGICGYEYTSDSKGNTLAKISLYCEDAKLLAAGSSGSPTETETDPKIVAPTGVVPKKPVALRSVAATLTAPRKLGTFELVVKSADYSTTPLTVADMEMALLADQKLFVVTYTLRNASAETQLVSSGTLSFQAVDSSGATYGDFKVGIGTRMAAITGTALAPEDIFTFSAVAIIPAVESVAKLRVTCPSDESTTDYTFAAK